ncbi:MAG: Alkane 1-monooxygenase [Candidatus Thorarchaeota archaeon]|nr:MAG: Alkane 1-monooxygenase [Candidatus Thorarchaeota archaeon]
MVSMRALPYTLIFTLPVLVITGYLLGGWWNYLTPFFVFVIVPILDIAIGEDTTNPPDNEEDELENSKSYRIITWLCVPIVLGLVFWGLYIVSVVNLPPHAFVGLGISIGINSGVMGINVGHELGHRVKSKYEMAMSRIILWPTGYLHWGLEHVVGHHRHVATPEDPATAKRNQSFYRFWPQTVFGAIRSVFRFEADRLSRQEKSAYSPHNRTLRHLLYTIALIIGVFFILGLSSLLLFLLQAFVAITLLEVINYIEHYGLERKETDNGYERVKITHSWNSSHRFTNWFLFNLQRHADHHYKPGRRYQILRHYEKSPQLPTGYAGMIWLALIPPLWKRIIHPRIDDIVEGPRIEKSDSLL